MEDKIYTVLLEKINDKDALKFRLEQEELIIDLNSEDQSYLRNLFYKILENLFLGKIEFKLEIAKDYQEGLFIDIATDYIKKLNDEIINIYNNIPEELRQHTSNQLEKVTAAN